MRLALLRMLMPLAFLTFPLAAQAEEPVVIFGNYKKPPKIFLDFQDQPQGILVDILRALEPVSGLSFDIQLYPWKRSYAMAEQGLGYVTGLSMTKERLEIFHYSDVLYYDDIIMIVRKGEEFPFRSMEDLRGKVVGVRHGSVYGDDFANGKDRVFGVDEDMGDLVDRLEKLLAGRIDVAVDGPGVAGFEMALARSPTLAAKRGQLAVLPDPLRRDPNYIGVAKSVQGREVLVRINQGLAALWENGTIPAIERRWLDKALRKAP